MKPLLWLAGLMLAGTLPLAPAIGQSLPTEAAESAIGRSTARDIWGTGFFVDHRGTILTAHHVVTECRQIEIAAPSMREPASILATSERDDLSLLRVERSFGEPLGFDSRDTLPSGTLITILGYGPLAELQPDGASRQQVLANGMILNGAMPREIALLSNAKPGGSGSPVIGRDGLVVGVLARMVTRDGLLFAGGQPREIRIAVSSQAARKFLVGQGVTPIEGGPIWHVAANVVDSLVHAEVKVECHR